jgi:hypothetical protein
MKTPWEEIARISSLSALFAGGVATVYRSMYESRKNEAD